LADSPKPIIFSFHRENSLFKSPNMNLFHLDKFRDAEISKLASTLLIVAELFCRKRRWQKMALATIYMA